MANTYTALHYHLVFSTHNREKWLHQAQEEQIWAYLGGIARNHQMKPLSIGGVEDHVHLLVGIPPTLAVSTSLQKLKGISSHWLKQEFSNFRHFGWQDGYGAFTVSQSNLELVAEYIRKQRTHHQHQTFHEEYLEFLRKHQIPFDERYVWG
jgi:putative transposase